LQRLCTMFPCGWPGRGLLLLRLGVVAILTHDGIRAWMGAPQREPISLHIVAAIAGVFLIFGLWTPVAGAIMALSEIETVLRGTARPQSTILLATQGIALAFLGPGSLSIDARLFGRKRLNYPSSRARSVTDHPCGGRR
jgi:putative oxidoreductase